MLMKYDYKTLYEKNAAFYNSHPKAKLALRIANTALTAVFIAAYAALWIYGLIVKLDPYELLQIFFVPLFALLVVSVLRLAVDRERPYSAKGAGIVPLSSRKGRENDSFPSRHLACAAVISMTFLPYLPVAGGFMLAGSILLGYARFALGLHYPSDLLAGIAVGLICGVLIFV